MQTTRQERWVREIQRRNQRHYMIYTGPGGVLFISGREAVDFFRTRFLNFVELTVCAYNSFDPSRFPHSRV